MTELADLAVGDEVGLTVHYWTGTRPFTHGTITKVTPSGQVVISTPKGDIRLTSRGRIVGNGNRCDIVPIEDYRRLVAGINRDIADSKLRDGLEKALARRPKLNDETRSAIADLTAKLKED